MKPFRSDLHLLKEQSVQTKEFCTFNDKRDFKLFQSKYLLLLFCKGLSFKTLD
jgi:hypothetical protein